ncbi:MAG TPA: sugar ABC transporter permease [Actinomycetota bacterium]|nr:sugar ABC transporter permease [Actinomycetota bacterium]
MATPFVIGVCALVIVPAAGSLAMAFSEWDLVRSPRFVGAANFRELIGDPVFRISLRNSLFFTLTAVPVRLAGALALALLLHHRSRLLAAGRVAVLIPTVIPDAAYALLWIWILNPLHGPLNLALGAAGLPTPAWLTQPTPARWGVVLMSAFQLGEGFLLALVARRQMPDELYEIASLSGAGRWSRFIRVTLPVMGPVLLLIAMRDTIVTLQGTFVPALVVTEGGPPPYATTYLPLLIYRNAFEYLRYGYASAATIAMLVVTASILWLQFRVVIRWRGRFVSAP